MPDLGFLAILACAGTFTLTSFRVVSVEEGIFAFEAVGLVLPDIEAGKRAATGAVEDNFDSITVTFGVETEGVVSPSIATSNNADNITVFIGEVDGEVAGRMDVNDKGALWACIIETLRPVNDLLGM